MQRKPSNDLRRARLVGSFLVGLLGVACLLPLGAALAGAQVQLGGIIAGRVMATEGLPERLRIQLLAEGDLLANEAYTDSNGNFVFTNLPNGTYWIVIEVPGFRPVRQVAFVDLQVMPRVQAEIHLERAAGEPKPSGQVIPGSPRSYQLNAKNAMAFSSKAVQEFEKGNKLQREEHFQAAMAHYQKALSIAPDFYPALNNLGALYLRQKDNVRAESAFLKSLELNTEDGEAYINLGHVLYEEGKYLPAIERLEEGLKRSPQSAAGHFFVGSACLKLGQLDKAERNLKTAYLLDPQGMLRARLQLANLYLKRNDMTAASAELEAYLQANPSDPQAPAIKKTLANIKAH